MSPDKSYLGLVGGQLQLLTGGRERGGDATALRNKGFVTSAACSVAERRVVSPPLLQHRSFLCYSPDFTVPVLTSLWIWRL